MCSLNQNVFDDAAGPNMATPSSKIDNFITKKIIKNPPIERFGSARKAPH